MTTPHVDTPYDIHELDGRDLERQLRLSRDKLTDRQRLLVEGVVSGNPVRKAAISAGYSNDQSDEQTTVSASRTLALDVVALYLSLMREKAARGAEVTAEWLREQLKEVVDMARAAGDHTNMVGACDKLAKIDGRYADVRSQVVHDVRLKSTDDLTPDEMQVLVALRHGGADGGD